MSNSMSIVSWTPSARAVIISAALILFITLFSNLFANRPLHHVRIFLKCRGGWQRFRGYPFLHEGKPSRSLMLQTHISPKILPKPGK
jgi:hypothetical protein